MRNESEMSMKEGNIERGFFEYMATFRLQTDRLGVHATAHMNEFGAVWFMH
jgi:hypothetical protein